MYAVKITIFQLKFMMLLTLQDCFIFRLQNQRSFFFFTKVLPVNEAKAEIYKYNIFLLVLFHLYAAFTIFYKMDMKIC